MLNIVTRYKWPDPDPDPEPDRDPDPDPGARRGSAASVMASDTATQTASASQASSCPSVTSHGTCSAAPSSRLATPYMPIGNTMLRIPGS